MEYIVHGAKNQTHTHDGLFQAECGVCSAWTVLHESELAVMHASGSSQPFVMDSILSQSYDGVQLFCR